MSLFYLTCVPISEMLGLACMLLQCLFLQNEYQSIKTKQCYYLKHLENLWQIYTSSFLRPTLKVS